MFRALKVVLHVYSSVMSELLNTFNFIKYFMNIVSNT